MRLRNVLVVVLAYALFYGQCRAADAPLVAVASSLRHAWPELMAAYQQTSTASQNSKATFGSSGNLARQISQGAPFTLFVSANKQYVDTLVTQGHASQAPVLLALGQLAWITHEQSPLARSLRHAQELVDGNGKHDFSTGEPLTIAIANPAFAPYGQAAVEVIDKLNLEPANKPRFAKAENAAQSVQFAVTGAVAGGIVPLSLVIKNSSRALNGYAVFPIDATQHQRLEHTLLLLDETDTNTKVLYDFLRSTTAANILRQHGFLIPDERD